MTTETVIPPTARRHRTVERTGPRELYRDLFSRVDCSTKPGRNSTPGHSGRRLVSSAPSTYQSAEVLEEDEESVKLRANVLPPVQRRVGLVLLIAGTDAFVTEPADLRDAGRDLARELLAHHAQ